jgi:Glycosyl transferases group 1
MSRHYKILLADITPREVGQGGAAWAMFQYILGLRRLGHEVWVVDPTVVDGSLKGFDVVLNSSGVLALDSIRQIPIRVYLDLDPAFNQLWHEEGIDRHFDGHTHFVTVGQAIGHDGCEVPTSGREWIGTLPPVVLDEWPRATAVDTDALTTVANFRGYGSIHRDGVHYGQKVHSLRRLIDLPRRAHQRLVLAMHLHADERRDITALAEGGWEIADPTIVAATPDVYRRFIQGSRAEIGITKSGYVVSRCGWFSDRSACYLASGRPVLAEETGFSQFLPTGEGLFAFSDVDGAVAAIQELHRDYARHSRAARAVAEEYLDSDRVLATLLERVAA